MPRPRGQVPDPAVRGVVDAGRDEALELLPRLVEHPDGGVARAGDLARDVEQLLQDRVDVELGGEDAAAGVDQAPEAGLVERGWDMTGGETTDRGCGDAHTSVQESADAGRAPAASMVDMSTRTRIPTPHAAPRRLRGGRGARPGTAGPRRDHRRRLAARSRPARVADDRPRAVRAWSPSWRSCVAVFASPTGDEPTPARARRRADQGARRARRAPRRRRRWPTPRASRSRSSSRSTRRCPRCRPAP